VQPVRSAVQLAVGLLEEQVRAELHQLA